MDAWTPDRACCRPRKCIQPWKRLKTLLVLGVVLLLWLSPPLARADPALNPDELAARFAPVLYFHPRELFRPQPVDVLLDVARLRQVRPTGPDAVVLPHVAGQSLAGFQDTSYYFDVYLDNDTLSHYSNYSALRAYYQQHASPAAGGPPVVTYARVDGDENPGFITIQYWFFYFYNDWFNKHEGDWEMIEVVLDAAGQPQWAVFSQHRTGTRRPWPSVPVEDGTHPVVYVALGSHANYFRAEGPYPHSQTVGDQMVAIMDRPGRAGRVQPQVILLHNGQQSRAASTPSATLDWLEYGGGWGERAPAADFSGPVGPGQKGEQWDRPYAWGMAQPLDLETWYANRLRVELSGLAGAAAHISLQAAAANDPALVDTQPGIAVLQRDLQAGETVTAHIRLAPQARFDLAATWPDPATSQVTRYFFQGVLAGAHGQVQLVLSAAAPPQLLIAGQPGSMPPTTRQTVPVLWDAPDFVWIAEVLPVSTVIWGVVLCLLATLIPVTVYLGVLYYADRYEKEPLQLLIGAFLWGAVPAVLIALATGIFFNLPADLLDRQSATILRLGLVLPVLDELLKAALVVFIVYRYRYEIDSVMDGVLYAAAVGLGFAMTATTIRYLGTFLLHGFTELPRIVFIEGYLYGINEAMYAAIFGAGLAYALFVRRRVRRLLIPAAAFALAVGAHALHNLMMANGTGVYPIDLAVTWLGLLALLVVVLRSLVWQRRWLQRELTDEVPAVVFQVLTRPRLRAWSEWQALRWHGLSGWRGVRRVFQLCGKLACCKAHCRAHADNLRLAVEVEQMRLALRVLLAANARWLELWETRAGPSNAVRHAP